MDSSKFTKDIEDIIKLQNLKSQKIRLVEFLKKNFKENINYIILKKIKNNENIEKRGGHNKDIYLLTEDTFELVKNTFNLKNKYIKAITGLNCVNICMSIENQTIGFIENSFKTILKLERQYRFKKYMVDLYFIDYNLVIECDENNHKDRNIEYEKKRENYILSLNNSIIRYNPNDKLFDLSFVLREIYKILFNNIKLNKVIIVEFL